MEWFTLVALIFKGVGLMEDLFSDVQQSGSIKKATLTNAIKGTVEAVGGISTGGQKETWDSIAGNVDGLIEGAVGLLNKTSNLVSGKDVVTDSAGAEVSGAAATAALG